MNILHPAFEWDDSVAAEKHREDQARYLVGALVVKVSPKGVQREVRAFVSVQQAETTGYTSLGAAMSDVELRRQVLARAWQELQAWRARYAAYSELAEVHAVIDEGPRKRG